MNFRYSLLFLLFFSNFSCQSASNAKKKQIAKNIPKNAILLFAPRYNDRYYKGYHNEILTFFKNIAQKAHPKDKFLFVADEKQKVKMSKMGISEKNIYLSNSVDIWARDICPVITTQGSFNFVYRPDYHSTSDSRFFEKGFDRILKNGGISWQSIPLNLDGGNFVFNGVDRAIVCEKVFYENPRLSEDEVFDLLKKVTGSEKIAFLPQEDGEPLGHADGMVSWIGTNTLLVNAYTGKMKAKVIGELKKVFPKVKLIEVPWAPCDDFRVGIADASGVYTNILHTANASYTMSFGQKEDKIAEKIIRRNSSKPVIVVPAGKISKLGGGIRCLSWQNRILTKNQKLPL